MAGEVDHRLFPKWGEAWKKPNPGPTIKECLMQKGECYPYEVWRYYLEKLREAYPEEVAEHKKEFVWHAPRYTSFYRYFYILEELKLIERTRTQKGHAKISRQYYKLTDLGKEVEEIWDSPQEYLYPTTYLGRRRYRNLLEEAKEAGISKEQQFLNRGYDINYQPDVAEKFGIDYEDVENNFLNKQRTVPYVRKPSAPPLKVQMSAVRATLECLLAEEPTQCVLAVEDHIKTLVERWNEVPAEDKRNICELIRRLEEEKSDVFFDVMTRVDVFGRLVALCR